MSRLVKFCFVDPAAYRPAYALPGDNGMDVYSTRRATLWPLEPVRLPIGCAFALPEGYELQVRPKSGLSARNVLCHWGTVDEQYRGEVMVVLTLLATPESPGVHIEIGQKIAQIVLAKVSRAQLVQVASVEDLGSTERGAGGFGSTGTGVEP